VAQIALIIRIGRWFLIAMAWVCVAVFVAGLALQTSIIVFDYDPIHPDWKMQQR
jgi:hypothetical protein